MSVDVSTPVFEGPFDLLLHLILREQVDLYEVSLTRIVDEYLAVLDSMDDLNLEVTTEFLLIAATLVELKARRLVPGLDDGELDDELALWEERDLLLSRLLEAKTYKDAAQVLARMHDDAARTFGRSVGPDERFGDLAPDALAGITPIDLRDAFMSAAAPKPVPSVDLHHVTPIRTTVVEVVAELLEQLPTMGRTTFRELTAALVDRVEIVIRFLAVLELYKQDAIMVTQLQNFGEIDIRWKGGSADEVLELVDVYEG